MEIESLNRIIDISAVKTNVSMEEIKEMTKFAIDKNLICVFGMPCYIPIISEILKDYPQIKVGGVVGFPSGAEPTKVKVYQTNWAIDNGADEIDMVINVGFLKSKMYSDVYNDIKSVVDAAQDKPVKVILEVGYLTDEEILKGSKIGLEAGAKFIKTGTGWSGIPTTTSHIDIIKKAVGNKAQIKAAGGINNYELLYEMYKMGVSRFGLGMNSITKIFDELS
ncbi:MAG: deoxyribose-phosphate aldolase [Peptostreptococcaceae bacterium]